MSAPTIMTEHLARLLRAWIGESCCEDLVDYLAHLEAGFECPEEALVVATIYILRLAPSPEYGRVMVTDVKKVILAALSLATKFLYDDGARPGTSSCVHAYAGGVTIQQLRELEEDLLVALDWRVFVDDRDVKALHAAMQPRELPPAPPAHWLPQCEPCLTSQCDSRAAAWGVCDASSKTKCMAVTPPAMPPCLEPWGCSFQTDSSNQATLPLSEDSDEWERFINFQYVDADVGGW